MGEVGEGGAGRPDGQAPLALLEAIDRDGAVRQAWRVERWPLSIGRALDNDVVLSEAHVAAHHATIDWAEIELGASELEPAPAHAVARSDPSATSAIVVRAGNTRNGLVAGGERVLGGQIRALADAGRDIELRIGRTHLRLRLAGHALAPEEAMAPVLAREHRWLPTLGLAMGVLAVVLFNTWIETDPDSLTRAAGTVVLTTLFGGAIWCGLWALLSKTFTRQSSFGWHVRVFVAASLMLLVLATLPSLLAFALSWPWVSDFAFVAVYATIATAVYFHLLAVEPARVRLMRGVAIAGFLAGVALSLWFNVQRTGRAGEELYMNHLFLPSMRVAQPVPVDSFVDKLAPMQSILDRAAKDPAGTAGDGAPGGGDDEE